MPPDRTAGAAPAAVRGRADRWLPPLLWTALILVGTSWPSISVGPDDIIGLDKAIHFGAYGVLALLVRRALLAPSSLGTAVLIVLALSGFGAIDEWHQSFINGRSSSVFDWIADTLGAITGVIAARYLLPPRRDRRPASPSPS
jgi:VanZ family protein